MVADPPDWRDQFKIRSGADLDFIIGEAYNFPVGLRSDYPAELKKRISAALTSYFLQLKSVDYTRRNYIDEDLYEKEDASLGDIVSVYLKASCDILTYELKKLHTVNAHSPGIIGAEITLYKISSSLNISITLSDRGYLLEVLPILRLSLEMISWAYQVFDMDDESKIKKLQAQNCIHKLKKIHREYGRIYGYLSDFAHWNHRIQEKFLFLGEENAGVILVSSKYRAISLGLCFAILDVLVSVIKALYEERSEPLILAVLDTLDSGPMRGTYRGLQLISEVTQLEELREILSFLPTE